MAKQRFKDEKGRIFCEACDFDFQETDGEDYIEAHHILPLGEIKEESVRKSVAHLNFIIDNQLFIKGVPHLIEHSLKEGQIETKIEDIVLLCCNCHKMVHKKRPWLKSIEEIKSLLFKDSRLKILG